MKTKVYVVIIAILQCLVVVPKVSAHPVIYVNDVLEDDVYLFSARLDVVHINEVYKLEIPISDSYTTLGGFIVDFVKHIPQKGEQIQIGNYHFIIEEAISKRIELVRMSVKE